MKSARRFEKPAGCGVEVLPHRHPLPSYRYKESGKLVSTGRQHGLRTPVVRHLEASPLFLSIHDETERHTLHPARAQLRTNLLPQHGGQLVAIEAVQHPARLLRLDQTPVDLPRIGQSLLDCGLGDLVKCDAPDGHRRLEDLDKVPADRFALPVFIGREEDLVSLAKKLRQLANMPPALVGDDVHGPEPVLRVDTQSAPGLLPDGLGSLTGRSGKVPDMPVRRLNPVFGAKEPPDRLCLRRRLHNHQLHADFSLPSPRRAGACRTSRATSSGVRPSVSIVMLQPL